MHLPSQFREVLKFVALDHPQEKKKGNRPAGGGERKEKKIAAIAKMQIYVNPVCDDRGNHKGEKIQKLDGAAYDNFGNRIFQILGRVGSWRRHAVPRLRIRTDGKARNGGDVSVVATNWVGRDLSMPAKSLGMRIHKKTL